MDDRWRRGVYGLANNFCAEECYEMKDVYSGNFVAISVSRGAGDTLVPSHVETQIQSGKETAC